MAFSLRTALTGITAAFLFCVATQAHAAGTVTIVQQSPIGMFGDYTLTFPSSAQVTINDQESKVLTAAENGTYLLHLTPPADAKVTTTVTKNGTDVASTVSRDVNFTVEDADTITVTIRYRYDGTIVVDSDPQGASFELLGPNDLRDTGITPATYANMAPGAYRVTFHRKEGCNLISPIQRSLPANGTLTLAGTYTCGVTPPPEPEPTPTEEPVKDTNEGRTLRIWAAAHQAEALAGNVVRTTITVRNTGTRTVHNVVISAQIDPSSAQFSLPLAHFGSVTGNTAFWEIPHIYAGKTWSVTLPIALSASLKQGEQTAVTARVSASDLSTKNTDPALVATATIGVTGLPPTGFRADILFLIFSMFFTAFCAKRMVRRMAEQQAS